MAQKSFHRTDRVSAHLYNDADDVAAFLAAMDAVA